MQACGCQCTCKSIAVSIMHVLFPCDPARMSRVEEDFARERVAAALVGFETCLYSHERLVEGDLDEAFRGVASCGNSLNPILLRGWMVPGEVYSQLYSALALRGYFLVTAPSAYEGTHYLPLAYCNIEPYTARSTWMAGDNPELAWECYQEFAHEDALIKDWVKSAKHRWKDACYIPAGATRERFIEIFSAFRKARGDQFNRGVVIRRFHPFLQRGSDIRGLPIIEEYRLFFWKGELIAATESVTGATPLRDLAQWQAIARKFENPFMTIDIALQTDGRWLVVEVGDGGVSGLPMGVDETRFYASLWNPIHDSPASAPGSLDE